MHEIWLNLTLFPPCSQCSFADVCLIFSMVLRSMSIRLQSCVVAQGSWRPKSARWTESRLEKLFRSWEIERHSLASCMRFKAVSSIPCSNFKAAVGQEFGDFLVGVASLCSMTSLTVNRGWKTTNTCDEPRFSKTWLLRFHVDYKLLECVFFTLENVSTVWAWTQDRTALDVVHKLWIARNPSPYKRSTKLAPMCSFLNKCDTSSGSDWLERDAVNFGLTRKKSYSRHWYPYIKYVGGSLHDSYYFWYPSKKPSKPSTRLSKACSAASWLSEPSYPRFGPAWMSWLENRNLSRRDVVWIKSCHTAPRVTWHFHSGPAVSFGLGSSVRESGRGSVCDSSFLIRAALVRVQVLGDK